MGDGPVSLVIAPTRELAIQIYSEIKKFCKLLNLTVRYHILFSSMPFMNLQHVGAIEAKKGTFFG
jgi:superfamily II DNA/RNA helicase